MELRLQPFETASQHLVSFELQLLPDTSVRSYFDAFGNTVHTFNHVPAHDVVEITSRSVVETASG